MAGGDQSAAKKQRGDGELDEMDKGPIVTHKDRVKTHRRCRSILGSAAGFGDDGATAV